MKIILNLTPEQEKDLLLQLLTGKISQMENPNPKASPNRVIDYVIREAAPPESREPFYDEDPSNKPRIYKTDKNFHPERTQLTWKTTKKPKASKVVKKHRKKPISKKLPYPKNLTEIAVQDYLKTKVVGAEFRWKDISQYVATVLGTEPLKNVGALSESLKFWVANFKIIKPATGLYRVIEVVT